MRKFILIIKVISGEFQIYVYYYFFCVVFYGVICVIDVRLCFFLKLELVWYLENRCQE